MPMKLRRCGGVLFVFGMSVGLSCFLRGADPAAPGETTKLDLEAKDPDGVTTTLKVKKVEGKPGFLSKIFPSKEPGPKEPVVKGSYGPLHAEVTGNGVSAGASGKVPIAPGAEGEVKSEFKVEGKHGTPNDIYPDGAPYAESHVEVGATFRTPTVGGRAEAELKMKSKPEVVPLFDWRAKGERLQRTLDAADPDGFSKPKNPLAAMTEAPRPKPKPFEVRPLAPDAALVIKRPPTNDPKEWNARLDQMVAEFQRAGRPLELIRTDDSVRIRDRALNTKEVDRILHLFSDAQFSLGQEKWVPAPAASTTAAGPARPAAPKAARAAAADHFRPPGYQENLEYTRSWHFPYPSDDLKSFLDFQLSYPIAKLIENFASRGVPREEWSTIILTKDVADHQAEAEALKRAIRKNHSNGAELVAAIEANQEIDEQALSDPDVVMCIKHSWTAMEGVEWAHQISLYGR